MTARLSQKGFSPIAIVVTVVIGLLVVGGLYMLGGEEEVAETEIETVSEPQTQEATPQATQVSEEATTSNKNYENAKHKVSFQYPNNWTMEEAESGFLSVHIANQDVTGGPQCPDGFVGVELQVGHAKAATDNFDAFVKAQVVAQPGGLSPGGKLEKLLVNGKVTYKVEHAGWDSGCKGPGYFIEQSPTAFTYVFTGVGAGNEQAGTQILTQIINSVKFQ